MSDATTLPTPAGLARLHRSDRRTLAISVLPDGSLELVAPPDATEAEIAAKVGRRLRWIVRQRAAFVAMNRHRIPLRYESGATHRYLGRQYRLKVRRSAPTGVRLVGAYLHIETKGGTPTEVKDTLDLWLREKAKHHFSLRLAQWSPWCATRKLPNPRLHLRQMPKRWGSAHPDGRIYLNPDLIKAPSICIDYVIAHEICHLQHPHHGRAFFFLLDQLLPDWPRIKARLERLE